MPPTAVIYEQGGEPGVSGLNSLLVGMFAWKEALLPALWMGFMDTDVPVASTVLLAPG